MEKLHEYNNSNDIEVQERANSACALINLLNDEFRRNSHKGNSPVNDLILNSGSPLTEIPERLEEIVHEMSLLFADELIPVAPKAQRKVPLPDGLDLDEWINDEPVTENTLNGSDDEEAGSSPTSSRSGSRKDLFFGNSLTILENSTKKNRSNDTQFSAEQIEKQRMQRLLEQSNNPHYLKSTGSSQKHSTGALNSPNHQNDADQYDNIDDIPITELSLGIPLKVAGKKNISLSINRALIILFFS